jgi:2-isopropylmalate synthase
MEQGSSQRRITIYDTTLRDGAQAEGLSFAAADKLKIARRLDELGVHYVEGGYPGSNPKDQEFFRLAREIEWENITITAFGSTRHKSTSVENDASVRALIGTGTRAVCIVGKAWDHHVTDVLETTMENNLAMIRETIAYLKRHGLEVFFDAEHFFDGYRANSEYAMAALHAAEEAGVDCLVLCDTNGGSMPNYIREVTRRVHDECNAPIGIHVHNDADLATANTLAAVECGATHVQGTVNGVGERCGNANLCTVIPNLQLKLGYEAIEPEQLIHLSDAARFVSEIANMALNPFMPYVGHSAFAHKAGYHADGMAKSQIAYQHVDPTEVGNEMRVLISELSGRSSVLSRAERLGFRLSRQSEDLHGLVEEIKDLEQRGFQFEGAEASFELLIKRRQPDYKPPFTLLDFLVLVETRGGQSILSEATVKIRVGDEVQHTAAEGNGPVNALDTALRKALVSSYPQLEGVRLLDYKVRVLDESSATEAGVRVMIESTNGHTEWSTVGSSTNIIEASYSALADSLEYAILVTEL